VAEAGKILLRRSIHNATNGDATFQAPSVPPPPPPPPATTTSSSSRKADYEVEGLKIYYNNNDNEDDDNDDNENIKQKKKSALSGGGGARKSVGFKNSNSIASNVNNPTIVIGRDRQDDNNYDDDYAKSTRTSSAAFNDKKTRVLSIHGQPTDMFSYFGTTM
jgi:hypothetical protein